MGSERTIVCEDCKQDYPTSRANTKVCAICRMIRDLGFIAERTKKCWICEEQFAPLVPGESACGKCAYHVRGHGETECAFCHETAFRIKADVSVCNVCARDPKHRRALFIALRRKQTERKDPVVA